MDWIKKKCRTLIAGVLILATTLSFSGPVFAEQSVGPGSGELHSTNGVTIYVSKRLKTLSLKQNGVLIKEYPVSLGASSSEGNKNVEGDMRTPSGEFYVCLRNDKSVAYLALGISYPGIKDAERGYADGIITEAQRDDIISANLAGKQPPWDTPLGGFVEIHGCRTSGGTTRGCVALDNDAMDVLWSYCNLGVPVTIGP
ncbi:L,D-transpeptidase family protein [Lacrimispora algidixylanolytica]|uniref:L,D-transpeptidase family protein n=1 Tax=Lacrimispora algidixylanolytica TaxID=94868 RepID=UPI001FA98F18|nr:L,D-transpeptidase [Lacrimispora algidixylanolytica]